MANACPIQHERPPSGPSECPIKQQSCNSSILLNPTNNMPSAEILQSHTDSASEQLSPERQNSSIPRCDSEDSSTWTYPSPRMFYNALLRKGKPVSADAIDSMLAIHNHLNEAVWEDIKAKEAFLHPECEDLKLKRFMGKPDELSPTAWWHVNVRGGMPPFDRHDWVIDRCGCEVRYVIDYYSGHPDPTAEIKETFNVDIRPALDSPSQILDRMRLWWARRYQ